MPPISIESPFGDVPEALLGLLRAQAKWGQEYLEAVTGTKLPTVTDPVRALQSALPTPVCHVPLPCWMPQSLGDLRSFVDKCGKACVRLLVTNCDRVERTVQVRAEGVQGVEVNPPSLHLGPMQRGTAEVSLEVPERTEKGTSLEVLVWVDGCKQHYLRWTIHVTPAGFDSCHEIPVDDCPDYRHHWYDHFYCPRPCPSGRSFARG
ncbi:MAG: hypothetical protein GEU90_05820 [Gemmatimonas sp.]|nr:hypothetical protein [Gemmatimonas sp.]